MTSGPRGVAAVASISLGTGKADTHSSFESKQTPLHYAIQASHYDLVKFLGEAGAYSEDIYTRRAGTIQFDIEPANENDHEETGRFLRNLRL